MSIGSFLGDCSLEITSKDVDALAEARGELPAGSAVSITFLPRDDIDELAAVAGAVRRLGFVPVPHISARRIRSNEELVRFLAKLRDQAELDRAFVVAGDQPEALGPFADALDVIQSGLLPEYGVRQVGIPGYPEGHPVISDAKLACAMKDKLAAIAAAGQTAEIVTQFVFDAEAVLEWLGALRADGIDTQVRIGLPGPATIGSLLRFAARCGVGASAGVMRKYGASITRLLSTATPEMLVRDLAAGIEPKANVVKAHLYPFGGVTKATQWAAAFFEAERV